MKTPQDQVRGGRRGGGDFPKHIELNFNSTDEHYLSTNQHLPAGVGHQCEDWERGTTVTLGTRVTACKGRGTHVVVR